MTKNRWRKYSIRIELLAITTYRQEATLFRCLRLEPCMDI
jgi:hypothetical protein